MWSINNISTIRYSTYEDMIHGWIFKKYHIYYINIIFKNKVIIQQNIFHNFITFNEIVGTSTTTHLKKIILYSNVFKLI